MVCCALPVTLKYRFNVEGKNQMAIFFNFIYYNAWKINVSFMANRIFLFILEMFVLHIYQNQDLIQRI